MSDFERNINNRYTLELLQKLSGYRNSLYPHPNLMVSLNEELPSEAMMM